MKKRNLTAFLLLLSMLAMTGCSAKEESSVEETTPPVAEAETEPETEAETEPPTNAPFPEADPNALTFDEIGADIAVIVVDDDSSVEGTLTVESLDGNNMLKFTDTSTTADNIKGAVQKIRFDVTRLLAQEQLADVNRIEFDVYAVAKDTVFVNDDGETPRVPGWIGGGGGTETCDGKWFGFTDFSAAGIQEYVLERSDAYHVVFKFTLAASGRKWDNEMTEPYLQVMRWGIQNISDFYLDNLTFYDADGNSMPLTLSDGWGTAGAADAQEDADADADEAPAEEEKTAVEDSEDAEESAAE